MEDLPTSYNPNPVEEKWYYFWERKGFFHADPLSDKEPYCIILPPPNVTGILHMGHAFVDTLQDILIRWKRMSGFEVLWVPGTDHAGISTQTVVEKYLMAKTGKRRKDFPREEFVSHIWEWKENHESNIIMQLKKLGCSCDWMRHRFTMDKEASLAVRTQFKNMFADGLIYRGDRLVNWDPVTQTAIADDEVEFEEKKGSLWYLRYPIEGDEENYITIATTRPETMLGDVAVAVSPKDERYKSLIGKRVILPIMNRSMPIIADSFVDPSFGTGAVKITPAHDHNDYEMGIRHQLPLISILTPDGKINENGYEYEGLTMEEARKEIVKKLTEMGRLEKIEPHVHRVGVSYRSKAIIEPFLSKQWFIRVTDFKQDLIDAVKNGNVKLVPSFWESTYYHWIENLRDWCISRQLWWGHRIPIWYNKEDPEKIICYAEEGEPPEVKAHPDEWFQDEDVLDTWFSSALWPFSTLGWPHHTNELAKFYPNATLVTGHDILFFWVARMILMGQYTMGKVPFSATSLQGLIYGKSYARKSAEGGITYVNPEEKKAFDLGGPIPSDVESKWEKMSKSKGNVIDPIEIINSYGADAIRMALSASATHSRQIDLDPRRFEEYKNFINKIWNGSRFVLMNLGEENDAPLTGQKFSQGLHFSLMTLEDRWILSRLNRVIEEINQNLQGYHFDRATARSYEFFWDEFCAYYVEMAKPVLFKKVGNAALREHKQKMLVILLLQALRLMHPIAPFITEEIFHLIKEQLNHVTPNEGADPYTKDAIKALLCPGCIVAPYPQVIQKEDMNSEVEEQFHFMNEIVYAIRNVRAEMQLPPNLATDLIILAPKDEPSLQIVESNQSILSSLIRIKSIQINPPEKKITGFHSSTLINGLRLIIPLPEELEEKEKERLKKEEEKILSQIALIQKQLSNPQFVERAPSDLVEKTRANLKELETKQMDIQRKGNITPQFVEKPKDGFIKRMMALLFRKNI